MAIVLFYYLDSQISEKKKLELIDAVIKSNPDMDQNEWGVVLAFAADTGDITLVDKILEKCEPMIVNAGLKTWLTYNTPFNIIPKFDRKMLDYLFSKGAEPKSREAYEALIYALRGLDIEMVKYFLDKGVPVNDLSRMNVLTEAVRIGNLEIVKLLIEGGADVNRNRVAKFFGYDLNFEGF